MSGRTVYFNGEFVPESEACVSIFDSALMFGDMAFEVTRTFRGKPFRLRQHMERLYSSLRLLEIDSGLTLKEMEKLTAQTLERNQSGSSGKWGGAASQRQAMETAALCKPWKNK